MTVGLPCKCIHIACAYDKDLFTQVRSFAEWWFSTWAVTYIPFWSGTAMCGL